MATIFGLDYAWGRPGPAAINGAGAKFVCRYLSNDVGKNLSASEAKSLSGAGIALVVVWETTAQRALGGKAAGTADAKAAQAQAKTCGMPAGRPIYFAVDWDATSGQQATINAYLDGAASVIGRDRIGLYGGYYPIKRAFDAGKIRWGWQTYAWSGGHWDSRAHIQQYSNGHRLAGVGVDYNRAIKSDYGQWRVGVAPTEDDLPFTEAQLKKIVRDAVWRTDEIPAPAGTDPKNPTWYGQTFLKDIDEKVRAILAGQGDVSAAIAEVAKKIGAPIDPQKLAEALLAGLTPQAIADAVVAAQSADLAQQVVDELGDRLSGAA